MFNVENAMRFNNKETVDAEFSAILAEINYAADIFVPGETYNDEMEEKAGQVFVRKLGKGSVKGNDATAENGLKFDTDQTADELLVMNKIYVLSKSELCPEAIDVARKSGKLAQKKEVVVRGHGESWQAQGAALLLKSDNHTIDADTDEITPENVVDKILAVQQQIIESDGEAGVCLVSPHVRTCLLSNFAKGKGFLPETNEEAKRNTQISMEKHPTFLEKSQEQKFTKILRMGLQQLRRLILLYMIQEPIISTLCLKVSVKIHTLLDISDVLLTFNQFLVHSIQIQRDVLFTLMAQQLLKIKHKQLKTKVCQSADFFYVS